MGTFLKGKKNSPENKQLFDAKANFWLKNNVSEIKFVFVYSFVNTAGLDLVNVFIVIIIFWP